MHYSRLIILLLAGIFVTTCRKKEKINEAPRYKYVAKVLCDDCGWILQNGLEVIAQKSTAPHYDSVEFTAKSGDTLLLFGNNNDTSGTMAGAFFRDYQEVKFKQITGKANPVFDLEYVVP